MLLMCVSFRPFPTAVLARNLLNPDLASAAAAVYSGTFVVIALRYNALWWYAVAARRLLHAEADPVAVRSISFRFAFGPVAYIVSLALAFVNVAASLAIHGVLMALYLLPKRRLR
jgi:uncharacterized membrane protein